MRAGERFTSITNIRIRDADQRGVRNGVTMDPVGVTREEYAAEDADIAAQTCSTRW